MTMIGHWKRRAALALVLGLAALLSGLTQAGVTYYHNDLLGSPIAATNEDGDLLWTREYEPYGEVVDKVSYSQHRTGYTGHQYDSETGITYAGARYYNQQLGRFLSPDPVSALSATEANPMMFNRYGYGNNNPYRYVDPDGNVPVLALWLVGAFFTGADIAMTVGQRNEPGDDSIQPTLNVLPGPLGAAKATLKTADNVVNVAKGASGAESALQGARLGEYYRQLEKYGSAGVSELQNGRLRFYGELKPAITQGEMAGARLVREWNPADDATRTWYEILDHAGTVRSVAPKPVTESLNHRIFDEAGNYVGRR